MTREKAIETLYEIALVFVEELSLTEYEGSDLFDLFCGIWGVGDTNLSDILRKKYGEMKKLTWHNGVKNKNTNRWEKAVELGYRFSNPQLQVFGHEASGSQTLAKIELSDYEYVDGELTHTDSYRLTEGMFWQSEGYETQMRLMQMWQERGGK